MPKLYTINPAFKIATNQDKGRHYSFIKTAISAPLENTSLHRALALNAVPLQTRGWYVADGYEALNTANLEAWEAQNQADRTFAKLQDIHAFAEPLLRAALQKQYGLDEDVKSTYLRLYLSKNTPWYSASLLPGASSKTVSLLDAALHNFAQDETFLADSGFISKPDANGHFDIERIKNKITIDQFKQLCRALDIGSQYNRYLESCLLHGDEVAKAVLEYKSTTNEKAALKAAAHLALLKKDVTKDAFNLMLGIIDGQTGLTLDGKVMQCAEVSMMDARLTGILLFIAAPGHSRGIDRMIAYVPHDPEHPLKEYESSLEFVQELTRQLQENKPIASSGGNYWQFFSQFLDQQHRGHFFADLDSRLSVVKWHEKDPLDPGPTWRATPVDQPRLEFRVSPVTQNLWQHLHQQKVSKIINDARDIAVSTAQADSKARWAWWDNFTKMLSDIFNAALLVLTPFVPGLGELMLAYTAYQLTTEVVEGVVDLAEGQWAELAEHVVGVVTDVIQLAAFGAGAAIGAEFQLKLSPFVEGMKPVQLPDGKNALWNPDLGPYKQQDLRLPDASQPDALGLHQHQGKTILPLEGQHFEIRHDPRSGQHRIQHPTRPQAYAPTLRHNGEGAWVHEAESPRNWEGSTLMRRIGHSVDRYSTAELENIRRISGTEDASLRRMHVETTAPPPLLADTLARLKIHDEVQVIGERIRSGLPLEPGSNWFDRLVPDMPGWPAEKALKVYQDADLSGASHTYGNPDAADAQTLHISSPGMMAGELPQRLVDVLNDDELSSLLGRPYPKSQQLQALRSRIAEAAEVRKADIFNYQYGLRSHSGDSGAQLLQRRFPELPAQVAETLVGRATPVERSVIAEQQRLPLRLKNQARESAFEVSAARAYEGFHEPQLMTSDTEQLTLNALKLLPATYEHLRIEVRDGTQDGPLRSSAGSLDAQDVRVLVRDEHGRFEVWDGRQIKRHEATDFYQAVLQALPENKRKRLGYRTTQGEQFKQWVMVMTEAPAERRTLLARPPIRPVVPRETELLLRGSALTKSARTVEEKVQNLYPHFDEGQVDAFSRSLHAQGDAHLGIERLEQELTSLRQTLENWRTRYMSGFDPHNAHQSSNAYWNFRREGGQLISDRLLECFERKSKAFNEPSHSLDGGYTLDLSAEFRIHDLERWWRELPDLKPYFDQVSTLVLDGSQFSERRSPLLKDFRHIRHFSARHCELTTLPEGVTDMRLLETLRLSDNQIRFSPATVEQLRHFTRMETLRLDNNALGVAPDISRMPRLKVLNLFNTGIDSWPPGLFSKPRPRGFFLDLQANPITTIPEVAPGSEKAFLIARTRVDTARMSDRSRLRYEHYRESSGMTPVLQYPPATRASAQALISRWPAPDDTFRLDESPGAGAYRAETWYDLVAEPQSEGFFQVLTTLTQSADYLEGGAPRQQLSDRVWRMIDAANLDASLREELFLMSTNPEGCEDAGAQLFNNMGIKVLASEAELFSTSAAERERKLVALAKGAARLAQVNEIARLDIQARNARPDEVEVHLAYETGLAKRLDLPWQSEAMRFRAVAGVTEEHINAAYDRIIEAESGDGLIDRMIKQPVWERYLHKTRPGEFEANTRRHQEQLDLLIDLEQAQREVAESTDLAPLQIYQRQQKLSSLATLLGVDQERVFTGQPMSAQTYERLQLNVATQERELLRKLTREAMARAELVD